METKQRKGESPMKKMIIGKIVNTFGIRGELKVVPDTDFVEERFALGQTLTVCLRKAIGSHDRRGQRNIKVFACAAGRRDKHQSGRAI